MKENKLPWCCHIGIQCLLQPYALWTADSHAQVAIEEHEKRSPVRHCKNTAGIDWLIAELRGNKRIGFDLSSIFVVTIGDRPIKLQQRPANCLPPGFNLSISKNRWRAIELQGRPGRTLRRVSVRECYVPTMDKERCTLRLH